MTKSGTDSWIYSEENNSNAYSPIDTMLFPRVTITIEIQKQNALLSIVVTKTLLVHLHLFSWLL